MNKPICEVKTDLIKEIKAKARKAKYVRQRVAQCFRGVVRPSVVLRRQSKKDAKLCPVITTQAESYILLILEANPEYVAARGD